jgi:hypothetical protein
MINFSRSRNSVAEWEVMVNMETSLSVKGKWKGKKDIVPIPH